MIDKATGSLFYLYGLHRYRQIKKSYSKALILQDNGLKYILNKSKDTAIGKHFGFGDIRSIKDYQRRVPLMRYEDMKPWIDGALSGKSDHVWPGRMRYFALTSGTTSGSSKYIPVSQDVIGKNKRAGLDCVLFYLINTKDKSIFDGKMLFLGGSTSLKSLPHNIFAGDMSGIMSRFLPFYISPFYEPAKGLVLIPDWEEKIYKIVESIKDKDIRLACGLPSWLLVLFDHLLKTKKKDKVCQVWKNISLLIHGGLDFSLYEKLMEDIIGKDIYYMETYFASEAFIGIQDTPSLPSRSVSDKGLLLMLDYGVFYEFVKAEDINEKSPTRYTVSDIQTDVEYAIVITNLNGLYSYIIGDTVKFLSKDPLRIKVTGRIESFLSALGEHIIAEEAAYAINQASSYTDALVNNYTVAPYYPQDKRKLPGHQWLIEFSKRPGDLNKFAKILDEMLCLKNDDYKEHRKRDFGMSIPSIYELREGIFYQWHREKGHLGGQHKTPHLTNDRAIAEELIRLNKKEQGLL